MVIPLRLSIVERNGAVQVFDSSSGQWDFAVSIESNNATFAFGYSVAAFGVVAIPSPCLLSLLVLSCGCYCYYGGGVAVVVVLLPCAT